MIDYEEYLKNNVSFNYLKNLYNSVNLAKCFGISNMEIRHSNFLAWILDPSKEDGFLKYFPIQQSLKTIQDNIKTKEYEKFKNLNIDETVIQDVKVNREKYNIDFVITLSLNDEKYVIAIENKITSPERSKQFEDYKIEIERYYPNRKKLFVLLHPSYNQLKETRIDSKGLLEESANENHYISVTYQDIYNNVLKEYAELHQDTRIKLLVEAYIHSLCCLNPQENLFGLIVTDIEEKNLKKLFEDDVFKLLSNNIENNEDFYKENKKVLSKICKKYRLLNDYCIDTNTEKILNKIEGHQKYIFDNIPFTSKAELLSAIIKDIIENYSIKTEDDFGKDIKKWLFNKPNWFLSEWYEGIETAFGGIRNKDDPIIIGNKKYYETNVVNDVALLEIYNLIIDKFPKYKDRIDIW